MNAQNANIFELNTKGCLNLLETNFYYNRKIDYDMIYNLITRENRIYIPDKANAQLYQTILSTLDALHKNQYMYVVKNRYNRKPLKVDRYEMDRCPYSKEVKAIIKKSRQDRRYALPPREFMQYREIRRLIPFLAGIEIEKIIYFVYNSFCGYAYEQDRKSFLLMWVILITIVKDIDFKRWLKKSLANVTYHQMMESRQEAYTGGTTDAYQAGIVSLRNQLYPYSQRNTLEKAIIRDMWLSKNILLTKSNGLHTICNQSMMHITASLSYMTIIFDNGKSFRFEFDHCGYKLMTIVKYFLKPYTKASGNCHLYEYIDEHLISNNFVELPNTNKKEYQKIKHMHQIYQKIVKRQSKGEHCLLENIW